MKKPKKHLTQNGVNYVYAGKIEGKTLYIENPHVGGGDWFVLGKDGKLRASQHIKDIVTKGF